MSEECCLVTDAGGYLGEVIVRELVKRQKAVHALFLYGESNAIPKEADVARVGTVTLQDSLRWIKNNAE